MRHPALLIVLFWLAASPSAAQAPRDIERLGEKLFTDVNLSLNRNQSCESCHSLARVKVPTGLPNGKFVILKAPSAGLADAGNVQDGTGVSNGSKPRAFGSLNAPSAGYAALTPPFQWNGKRFIGGQFWNGRARDLVEQAKGPFLNPLEMAMPDRWSVIERLRERGLYRNLFFSLFDINLDALQPGAPEVSEAYDAMATAIAAFERTATFNRFDSKFDFVAAGMTSFDASEQRGADLFNGAALCSQCHTTTGIAGPGTPAIFSDFRYENVGMPANPQIPGLRGADPGLAGNPGLEAARGGPTPIDEAVGRHKTVSLRNVELTPPYMHNGVLKTLEEVVHYYNTRDVLPACADPPDPMNPGFGITCWARGEYHETRNTELMGNLGLSEQDEADIVSFLRTLTDNYPKWGNSAGRRDPAIRNGTPSPFADFPIPDNSQTDVPEPPSPSPPGGGTGEEVALISARDATIFSDELEGTISNGRLFVGRNRLGSVRRGLIAFDLGAIPTGSTIGSVVLTLTVSDSVQLGYAIRLHRVQADWGEGSTTGAGSAAAQPQPAMADDPTWQYRFFDATPWSSPGGDFVATASASSPSDGVTTWTGTGLRADVQHWVDNPGSNFGWILIGDENTPRSVQGFYSREWPGSVAPSLVVTYSTP